MQIRRTAAVLTSCAALTFAGVAAAAPASADPRQEGLVNVNVSGNNVQVPIGVAANVCGISVAAVLAIADADGTACTATVEQLPRAFQ